MSTADQALKFLEKMHDDGVVKEYVSLGYNCFAVWFLFEGIDTRRVLNDIDIYQIFAEYDKTGNIILSSRSFENEVIA